MAEHTEGERVFESYLESQGLHFDFEKEHAGKSKRPDYTIEWNDKTVVFDVKDFEPPEYIGTGPGAFNPYSRIREKIEQGRDKFKQFKEFCCALVLYNPGNPSVHLQHEDIMLGAMYGDSGFTFPVSTATGVGDASQMKHAFLGNGKMLRPDRRDPQNTTISALTTLSKVQPDYLRVVELIRADTKRDVFDCIDECKQSIPNFDIERSVPRVIVWHNAVARVPFPSDLFRGPYDTHFGVVQEEDGSMWQRLTYRGNQLSPAVKV